MDKIQSSPNRAKPPRFEDMNDEVFEEFSCALLEKEPDIIRADLYKTRRQKQYGVDIIGELETKDDIHVVSCKVRQALRKGDISKFGDEFLDHWDNHWKKKNVRKFILTVTKPVNSDQREKEIEIEKTRFLEKGIKYEAWSPRTLQAKMRPYRDIVSQYLGDNIANDICGKAQPASAPKIDNQSIIDASIVQQLANLHSTLSKKVDKQLQEAREKIKRKKGNEVDTILNEIATDTTQWSSLTPSLKAAVKRLQASRAVHQNNIPLAKELCAKAESLDRNQIMNLKALIALAESGPTTALRILDNANTPDEIKLKAGLELTAVSAERALNTLKLLPKKEKDGEVLRLYALAYLMEGKRDKAIQNIEEAEKDFGEWYAVQRTAIAIRFHLAHPSCIPFHLSAWPNPIIPELIMEDNETLKHLTKGLSIVEKLIEDVTDDRDEQKDLQVWHIAYLSNIKSKSPKAEKDAAELLKKDSAFAGVIIWALARGYKFDVPKSKAALKKLIEDDKAEIEQILCLASIYHSENDNDAAKEVLEKTRSKFDTPELIENWKYWHVKSDIENAASLEATVNIDEQLAYLISSENWLDLAGFLKKPNNKNLHNGHVFIACLNFAQYQQWPLIKPYTSVLTNKIKTASAIRIAATCTYNTNDCLQTIRIIDNNKHIFSNEKLPIDMRKLHNRATLEEGDVAAAISDGEKLVIETNNIQDRFEHINTLISIGDLPSATHHIKAALNQEKLPAQQAFILSNIVQRADPNLANQLFQQINHEDLPSELLGSFVSLAYKLGHDDSPIQEIFGRMEKSGTADTPLVRQLGIGEMQKFIHAQNEQSQHIDKLYTEGSIPAHFILSHQGIHFSDLILGNFSDKHRQELPQKSKLLFRFGGRTPNLDIELENTNLYLDVGSVFIAHKLNLLELIEENTASINISPHLQTALIEMENNFGHHQPERLKTMKSLLLSADKSHIKAIAKNPLNAFDILDGDQRTFVVYHDVDNSTQEQENHYDAINIKQVINCLHNTGVINDKKVNKLKGALPSVMGTKASEHKLQNGDRLIFEYNTLEVLASENLLPPILKTFDVYLDQTYIEDTKTEIAQDNQKNVLENEVMQLRQFLANKLKSSQYKLFSQSDMDNITSSKNEIRNESENCLTDLVRLKQKENTVIWADDRAINRHTSVNGNQIVDVYDIINLFLAQGLIDNDNFYDLLISLRKANYYYIPVTPDEVLYHLQKATVKTGYLQETEELKIIRQYVSMVAVQENFLYFNYQEQEAFDEKKLLVSTFTLTDKSILSVWNDQNILLEAKEAYSSWIWDLLRLEHLKRVPVHQTTNEGYEHMYALLLAGLLTNIVQIPFEPKDLHKHYIQWLEDHVLHKATEANTKLPEQISKSISTLLLNIFEESPQENVKKEDRNATRAYLSNIVQNLPDKIQEHIIKDTKLSSILGLTRMSFITIKDKNIEPENFWNGIYKALNKGKSEIEIQGTDDKLNIHLLENKEQPIFSLNSDKTETLTDPIFNFLSSKETNISNALKRNRDWFEYPLKHKNKIKQKILNEKDLTKRITFVQDERKNAPAYKYAQLEEQLLNESSFDWAEINPAPTSRLINHLRLNETRSKKIKIRINKAAENLISEEGIITAFRMFSGLPFYIPEPIIQKLHSMRPKALDKTLEDIFQLCHSPLRLFHLLYIARKTKKNPRKLEFIDSTIIKLKTEGIQLCDSHTYVLRYFERIFSQNKEWLQLDSHEKIILCWYHSDQIANLLIGYGMPLEDFKTQFMQRRVPSSNHFLLQDENYRTTPYSPSNITAKNLLFTGIKISIGDDCTKVLSDTERDKIKNQFIFHNGDQSLTDISIIGDTSEHTSPLQSFLSENNYKFALSLGGKEFSKWLSDETIGALIQEIKGKLSSDPNDLNYWLHLHALYKAGLLPDNALEILEFAPNINFYSLFKRESDLATVIIQYISETINFQGNEELVHAYKNALLKTIKQLSNEYKQTLNLEKNYSEASWITKAALSLSEAFLILSRHDTTNDTLHDLSNNIISICTTWPPLALLWRKTLNSIIEDLDFLSSTIIWETQIKLRTME